MLFVLFSCQMVPPRGCAYVQMAERDAAYRALNSRKIQRLRGQGSDVKVSVVRFLLLAYLLFFFGEFLGLLFLWIAI